MNWTEFHHAWIVSEFYRLLLERWPNRGPHAFRLAARTYGEQRGRRMAMRVIGQNRPLGLLEYFAFGEYTGGEELFDLEMWGEEGVVHEKVTRCPWAEVFARRELTQCGVIYCQEIDRAIVRGFNPQLELETASTQHTSSCCRFYFRQPGIPADTLDQADAMDVSAASMPMSYHCAHVYHTFASVAQGIFGTEGARVADQVGQNFEAQYGRSAHALLLRTKQVPFDTILSLEEWLTYDPD